MMADRGFYLAVSPRRFLSVKRQSNLIADRAEAVASLAVAVLIVTHMLQIPLTSRSIVDAHQDGHALAGHQPFVKVFRGPQVPKKLSQIAVTDPLSWKVTNNRIAALATGTKVKEAFLGALTFEWETLYAFHWGTQEFHELGGAIYARWNRFPWNSLVRTTFAIGIGPSYTSGSPRYEPKNGKRSSGLSQLNFEFNFYLPDNPRWAIVAYNC